MIFRGSSGCCWKSGINKIGKIGPVVKLLGVYLHFFLACTCTTVPIDLPNLEDNIGFWFPFINRLCFEIFVAFIILSSYFFFKLQCWMQQTKTYYKFEILDTLIWQFKINHHTTTTIRTVQGSLRSWFLESNLILTQQEEIWKTSSIFL